MPRADIGKWMLEIIVRNRLPEDDAAADELWTSVGPYRPGDEPEVEAMHVRALRAKEQADPRWIDMPRMLHRENARPVGWVAVQEQESGLDYVVGISDIASASDIPEMPQDFPAAKMWRNRDDVAEVTRLSVRPAFWRLGVGSRLMASAITWAEQRGFRLVILKTTVPQVPAQRLYLRLGFREVARTFVDKYELVWFELPIGA